MNKSPFTMYNGISIPVPGFGTYKAVGDLGRLSMETAVAEGYRHFDTASFYKNEKELGEVLVGSGLPRKDFFITTKLWAADQGYDNTLRSLALSLKNLGTDYLDLYLIHWPRPQGPKSDPVGESWKTLNRESWRAMNRMYEEGVLKGIGVSNFLPHHIENIECAGRLPMADQLEYHPGYLQKEAVAYCQSRGIVVEGWSPFGRGRVLDHPLLAALAAKHSVSAAQVCVKFALQMGVLPLPKASSKERIRENRRTEHFTLTEEELSAIRALPLSGWSGEHPDRPKAEAMGWQTERGGTA